MYISHYNNLKQSRVNLYTTVNKVSATVVLLCVLLYSCVSCICLFLKTVHNNKRQIFSGRICTYIGNLHDKHIWSRWVRPIYLLPEFSDLIRQKQKQDIHVDHKSVAISSQSVRQSVRPSVHQTDGQSVRPSVRQLDNHPKPIMIFTWWKQPTASMADVEWLTLASIFKIYNSKKDQFYNYFCIDAEFVMSYQVSQLTL